MTKITRYMPVIERVKAPDGTIHEAHCDAPVFEGYDGPHIWYWQEGNMGCDCNRAAICGVEDFPCNAGDPVYKLNLIDATTGAVVYKEFEE